MSTGLPLLPYRPLLQVPVSYILTYRIWRSERGLYVEWILRFIPDGVVLHLLAAPLDDRAAWVLDPLGVAAP